MRADEGGWRRLHPASMLGQGLRSLPGTVAGIVGSYSALAREGAGAAMLGVIVVLALVAGLTVLGWWRFRFRVGASEIAIERGVLGRKRRVIPFDRVRDVAIERKLLARLLGTARVRIETGGGSADEGDLEMIRLNEAEQLREHIRRTSLLRDTGAQRVEAAAAPEERIVFSMSGRRVLIAGLFNFSLLFIAIAGGGLQYLDDLQLFDITDWVEAQRSRPAAPAVETAAVVLLIGALLLLGVVTGLARTVAREFRFRLAAGPNGLRRRRGLVTLSEVLIPARRTEAARIERRWVSGAFGWRSLAFQTLGADPKEGGVQVAAPLARPEEVHIILREAGFPEPSLAGALRPPARALLRRCGPYLLLAAALAALSPVRKELLWLAALPILFAGGAWLRWRFDRYCIGDSALFVARGALKRTLWIVPFEKLQTLNISAGPVQRLLGLAHLVPDTAGAPGFGAPRLADLPADAARLLADQLLAAFYARRAGLRDVTEQSR